MGGGSGGGEGGYAHIVDIEGVQKMLDEAKRWQIVLQDYNFIELLNKCDNALFRASLLHNHCLNHLYTVKQHIYCTTLRRRRHNFELPVLRYRLAKNSFINPASWLQHANKEYYYD